MGTEWTIRFTGRCLELKIEKSSRHRGDEMMFNVTVNFPRLPQTKLEEAGFQAQVDEFLKASNMDEKKDQVMAGDADWLNILNQWKNIRSEFAQPAESRP